MNNAPLKPLPFKPSSGLGVSSVPTAGRAQNFSVSKLQQHVDREHAQVSVDRFINKRDEHGPSTSVMHDGGRTQASTSVMHDPAQPSVYDESEQDEIRDRLRYQHIRKMMKERQKAEEELASENVDRDELHVSSGKSFRQSGVSGFQRRTNRFFRSNKSEYKNISKEDRDLFKDTVSKRLTQKRTGSSITRRDRKIMRKEMKGHYKSGAISKVDYKDFKKLIGNMD